MVQFPVLKNVKLASFSSNLGVPLHIDFGLIPLQFVGTTVLFKKRFFFFYLAFLVVFRMVHLNYIVCNVTKKRTQLFLFFCSMLNES